MSQTETVFCERTEGGVTNIPAITQACMTFPIGKRLQVSISLKSRRSTAQNKWFHACAGILGAYLGYSKEETKNIVKFKFLKRELVNENSGEVFEYILETSKLSKEEFTEFMENFMRWSLETFDVILPLPDSED